MELYTFSPNVSADTISLYQQLYNNYTVHMNYSNASGCPKKPWTIEYHLSVKIVLSFLYSLIFFTAVSGNLLVIYVVVFNKHMHTVTNFFITNLAISDLMVNLTSLWLTPLYTYLKRWVWGGAMCHIFPCAQGMSLYISTMTLTAIAIDRYIVILYPFAQRISIQLCLTVTISIWVLSFMLVVPYTINMKHIYLQSCEKYLCLEAWMDQKFKAVFGVVVMVLQFGIPFIIITFCYICIWMRLITRANQSLAHSSGELQRKRRMAKMLTSMVVIFALCSLPVNVLNVLRDLKMNNEYFTLFFLLAHVCLMSATCWNPILYAWMNEYFQREFKTVLPCFPTVNRRTTRTMSLTRSINKSTTTARQTRVVGVVLEANTALVMDKSNQITTLSPSDISPSSNRLSGVTLKTPTRTPTKTRFDLPSEEESGKVDDQVPNGKLKEKKKRVKKQVSLDSEKKVKPVKKYSTPTDVANGQCQPLIIMDKNKNSKTETIQIESQEEFRFSSEEEATSM